jgi:hypothetical protein
LFLTAELGGQSHLLWLSLARRSETARRGSAQTRHAMHHLRSRLSRKRALGYNLAVSNRQRQHMEIRAWVQSNLSLRRLSTAAGHRRHHHHRHQHHRPLFSGHTEINKSVTLPRWSMGPSFHQTASLQCSSLLWSRLPAQTTMQLLGLSGTNICCRHWLQQTGPTL